jgi:hypothetical protein
MSNRDNPGTINPAAVGTSNYYRQQPKISIDHVVAIEYISKGWVDKPLKIDACWLKNESLTIGSAVGGHSSSASPAV